MGALSLRLLTALLVVLGSGAATSGLNEAVSVANGLVSASQAAGQSAHASLNENFENFDLDLTDEVKRELDKTVIVNIYNTDNCGVEGWWDKPCYEKCGEDNWWHPQCDKRDESPVTTVYCADIADYEEAKKIPVKWNFFVETNSKDPSNLEEQVFVALTDIMLDALSQHCTTRRKLFGSRRLAIQGYSKEIAYKEVEECRGNSTTCNVFEAEMDIVYNTTGDDNNAEEVTATVRAIAEDALNGDEIENIVNKGAGDDDEVVTNVGYGDGPEKDKNIPAPSETEATSYEQDNGLSKGEKAAIAIAAILLLLLLILCCLWRRHLRRKQEEAWASNKSVATEGTTPGMVGRGVHLGSNAGSYAGSYAGSNLGSNLGSNSAFNSGSDGDDATYRTSDFNNLGLHHSKVDVHRCSSASCDQCNPTTENPPGIFFLSVQRSKPRFSSIVKNDNDDKQTPAQKGVFERFRGSTTKKEDPPRTTPNEMTEAIEMEI